MSLRLRCGNCGKAASIGPEDAGQRVLCRACGQWTAAPPIEQWPAAAPEPAIEPAPPVEPANEQPLAAGTWEELDHATRLAEAVRQAQAEKLSATISTPLPPPPLPDGPGGSNVRPLAIIAAAIGIALLTGGLVLVLFVNAPDGWERANAPQLLSLKAEAESLVKEGRLADAHTLYREMQERVGARRIRDERLRGQVEAARNAQERIFLVLISQTGQSPRPGGHEQQPAEPAIDFTPPTTQPAPVAEAPPVEAEPTPAGPPQADVRPEEPPKLQRPVRPPVRPMALPTPAITDEQIGDAIKRGVDYLLAQLENGELRTRNHGDMQAGLTVLAVYALLQSGDAIHDERLNIRGPVMKPLLDKVRDLQFTQYNTYIRGLRATALSMHNRPDDRSVIRQDVQWLLQNHRHGAYTYNQINRGRGETGHWDNSNSQYGLLGVWSAAEIGVEVPRTYWADVQKHWVAQQHDSGEWGYRTPSSQDTRLSMTVAGLASLFVTHDWLDPAQFGAAVGREPFSPALARGLAYLESGGNAVRIQGGYTLYGLERVGLASGFKYFGEHDWYRALARQVLRQQGSDGSIGGSLQETCFCLLFLARGRHPILMNKLRYDGNWANRPRDVANLARFASRELERTLNWQVVPITRDWTDWMDSPILYFAGHNAVEFADSEIVKLRRFVEAGGMIFTQADGGRAGFNESVIELARRVFPGMEFTDLPDDHSIFNVSYQISARPKFKHLTNGSRVLWLHSPEDISQHWQLRADRTKRSSHELGVNLFIYAAGKRDFRNRLASTAIPEPYGAPIHRIRIARVRYDGAWDPEPGAMPRFARWFRFQTGYQADVRTVGAEELDARLYPIAHLTGVAATTFTDGDVAAMKRYVESGGVLLVEACGGAAAFDQSASALFQRILGSGSLEPMSLEHPLISGKIEGTRPLPRTLLRQYAEQKLGRGAGRLMWASTGEGKVVYSSMDISTALLGTETWGIVGYRPDYALDLMRNALIWAADGAPVEE